MFSNTVYLFDLGIARAFKEDNRHVEEQYRGKGVGTTRYASLNCHKGNGKEELY